MSEIKKMDIREFREKGYLQELNRNFLHPLGLALEINIDSGGKEILGGIWDYREDEEGIYYDIKNSNLERKTKFARNEAFILQELFLRKNSRLNKLGYGIEPINNLD